MKKIAIFIDGSNFASSMAQIGVRADFSKIHTYFSMQGDVCGCYYFTGLPPRDEDTNLRRLTDKLSYSGWNVISKETRTFGALVKGNMDVEIAVLAMELSEFITDLILFSGDGDFRAMVESLQRRAVRVTAVSLHRFNDKDSMMSDLLRRQVNTFIDIKEIADIIALNRNEDKKNIHSVKLDFKSP